ncbi:MAG: hypothetical protein PHQ52_07775, partial [Candidatus Omnitrophica bacterium]|nr:hypothetical protein [Candidatus Omnitrophota bacterium]
LEFTPKTKLLCRIGVYWDLNDERTKILGFGEKIRDWINNKFGDPSDMIGSQSEYVWGGQDSSNRIELFYLYPTRIIYYGGKYFEQFLSVICAASKSDGMDFSPDSEQIVV